MQSHVSRLPRMHYPQQPAVCSNVDVFSDYRTAKVSHLLTKYLYFLGYLHNDISPCDIVLDSSGVAVLIDLDLDSCTRIGEKVENGGVMGGWRRTWAFGGRYL